MASTVRIVIVFAVKTTRNMRIYAEMLSNKSLTGTQTPLDPKYHPQRRISRKDLLRTRKKEFTIKVVLVRNQDVSKNTVNASRLE